MVVCGICGETLTHHHQCYKAHEDICHDCWSRSMSQGYEHPPPAPRLSAREQRAVSAYTAYLRRTVGAEQLMQLVREEDEA